MKEPMIPRSIYDDLQIRYDDLQTRYHELVGEVIKRDPPPPEQVTVQYTNSADDNFPVPEKVLAAIHTYSEPESTEANTTQEIAFGMLRDGMSEEDVIVAVHAGEDVKI